MAEISPDADEEGKVGYCNGRGDVVEGLGRLKSVVSSRRTSVGIETLNGSCLTAKKKSLISCVMYTVKPM